MITKMAIIVPVMEIPITVEILITEIQAPTGIQASVEAVTQQGVVIREKMYLLLGRILRGFSKKKSCSTARGKYQSSGICLLFCLSVLMSIWVIIWSILISTFGTSLTISVFVLRSTETAIFPGVRNGSTTSNA